MPDTTGVPLNVPRDYCELSIYSGFVCLSDFLPSCKLWELFTSLPLFSWLRRVTLNIYGLVPSQDLRSLCRFLKFFIWKVTSSMKPYNSSLCLLQDKTVSLIGCLYTFCVSFPKNTFMRLRKLAFVAFLRKKDEEILLELSAQLDLKILFWENARTD